MNAQHFSRQCNSSALKCNFTKSSKTASHTVYGMVTLILIVLKLQLTTVNLFPAKGECNSFTILSGTQHDVIRQHWSKLEQCAFLKTMKWTPTKNRLNLFSMLRQLHHMIVFQILGNWLAFMTDYNVPQACFQKMTKTPIG